MDGRDLARRKGATRMMNLEERVMAEDVGGWWWVFLLIGIVWLIIGFVVTLVIMRSFATRGVKAVWGLGLAVGILEILLAIWVSQRFFPARAELILLWVGFMAIFRGISHIVVAFGVRRVGRDIAAAV